MNLTDALKHYKTRTALAAALGITRQAITRWGVTGVPRLQQYRIEELTRGKVKRNRS